MGYGNPDIEEIRTQDLLSELEHRKAALEKGLCPYCGKNLIEHACRFVGQMMEQYNYDEFSIKKFNEQKDQKPH